MPLLSAIWLPCESDGLRISTQGTWSESERTLFRVLDTSPVIDWLKRSIPNALSDNIVQIKACASVRLRLERSVGIRIL